MEIGDRIGDYEIVQILGAGGMGKVYKVRNVIADRIEAMKVLLPDLQHHPELADRFLREIKVQAKLSHPNIAGLLTAFYHHNQLLMLMEFIEGDSIEKILTAGAIPIPQAVDYVSQVLQALSYAHATGVIHRDIKPPNIMVTPRGQVKLMDFGIAKMKTEKRLTQTGHTVGSLYYMSPEQINGTELDARADLYSLGITFYQMVTGRRPFEGNSDFSIMSAHLKQAPVPPIQLDPTLPPALNDIILMSIAKDPNQRFQTADAFRNALSNVAGSPSPTVPFGAARTATTPLLPTAPLVPTQQTLPPPPPLPAPRSNRGLWIGLGSLLTLGALIGGLTLGPQYFGAPKANQEPAPQTQPDPAITPSNPAVPVQDPAPAQPQQQDPQPAPVPIPAPARPASQQQSVTPAPPVQQYQPPAQQQPVPQPQPQQTQQQPVQQPPPQQQPQQQPQIPAPPAQRPAVDTALLDGLQDRMLKLTSRASVATNKITRIESEQRALGVGMRGDVKAAQVRMSQYMDNAEAALKSGNAPAAKSALDRAEREVEFLEDKLGI